MFKATDRLEEELQMELARRCPKLLAGRSIASGSASLGGMPVTRAAESAGVSRRTAFKWKWRYRDAGEAALVEVAVPSSAGSAPTELIRTESRRFCGCAGACLHGSPDRRPGGLEYGHGRRVVARSGLSRLKSPSSLRNLSCDIREIALAS